MRLEELLETSCRVFQPECLLVVSRKVVLPHWLLIDKWECSGQGMQRLAWDGNRGIEILPGEREREMKFTSASALTAMLTSPASYTHSVLSV